jgi:hypothetical protein
MTCAVLGGIDGLVHAEQTADQSRKSSEFVEKHEQRNFYEIVMMLTFSCAP